MEAQPEGARHEDVLGFQFVCKGVELVREGDRELALQPGDVVLWDGLQPTDVEIVEPFYKRTLLFPRERVLAVCPRLGELSALPSLKGSAPGRLLVRYMNALALELPQLEAPAAEAAANAALELLRAAVEPGLATSRSAQRTAMRAEIRRYVRAHLQEARARPGSDCAHLRHLLRGAARAVRGRGLHRGRARAQRATGSLPGGPERLNGGSVTDIAFRWGFGDAAHFRGRSPARIRRDAQRGSARGARRVAPQPSARGGPPGPH